MKNFYWGASIAAAICVAALVTVFLRHRPGTPSDWAAWAQAATAAVAIVATAIAVAWQQWKQKEQQIEAARVDQTRRLQIIGGALFSCRVIVEYLRHEIQLAGVSVRTELEDFSSQLKSLERIAPFDYPDWPSFHAVEALGQTFRANKEKLAKAAEILSQQAFEKREEYLDLLLAAVERAETIVEYSLAQAGGKLVEVTNTLPSGYVVYSRGHAASKVK